MRDDADDGADARSAWRPCRGSARATVLDLACGSGRHARWLAARGHRGARASTATRRRWPRLPAPSADDACGRPGAGARGRCRPRAGSPPSSSPITCTARCCRICSTRSRPGGVLLYETFAAGNETVGKPSNPAFLLAPGELLDAVRPRLRVVAYRGWLHRAMPRDRLRPAPLCGREARAVRCRTRPTPIAGTNCVRPRAASAAMLAGANPLQSRSRTRSKSIAFR